MWLYRTILLVAFTLFATNALALDSYTIQGVNVEATANSATLARNKAIDEGEKEAFYKLLKKILPNERDIPEIKSKELKKLILSRQIKNEKFSSSSYRGTIDVKFSKQRVKEFLKSQRLNHVKSGNTPILIIPVFRTEEKLLLWEDNNLWRNAWSRASSNLFKIVMPNGDIDDITTANKYDIIRERTSSLENLALKYDVEDVIISEAFHSGNTIEIKTKHFDGVDLRQSTSVVHAGKNDSLKKLLNKAVVKSRNDIEKIWKQTASATSDTDLQLIVPINSLEEWTEIRQKLSQMGNVIESLKINAIAYGQADIGVTMTDAPQNLIPHFRQNGLNLSQEGNYWILTKI